MKKISLILHKDIIYNQIQKIINSIPEFKANYKEDNADINKPDANDNININIYFCVYKKLLYNKF